MGEAICSENMVEFHKLGMWTHHVIKILFESVDPFLGHIVGMVLSLIYDNALGHDTQDLELPSI